MDKRKFICKKDFFVIGIAALLALSVYVYTAIIKADATGTQAKISWRENVVVTVSLEEDKVFSLAEHPAVKFIVSNGRIAFYKSDCPDQICVRNGFLYVSGQNAICLPNRVVLTIVGTTSSEYGIDFFLD